MNERIVLQGRSLCITLVLVLTLTATGVHAKPADSLTVGDSAPGFSLPWASKDSVSSARLSLQKILENGAVVLAFYPADWSGGCTKEMCSIRDNFASFSTLGVAVYGISGDYVFSHREWAKTLNLPFILLSDHDHSVARVYQSYNESTGYNKRSVFLIDQHAKVVYLDRSYKVSSPESFENLMSAVKSLR